MAAFPKITSGGQTGADRAALDFAIANGIPHGGWCPSGRKALDGRIPQHYNLQEPPSDGYLQRNEFNVREEDVTAIFTLSRELTGGSKQTEEFAEQFNKPFEHITPDRCAAAKLFDLLLYNQPRILNVAGSRGDGTGGIERFVQEVLQAVWDRAGRK